MNLFSPMSKQKVCLVVAHPDDETLAAVLAMKSLRRFCIVHTTDGSPRELFDAHSHGFRDRTEYAKARQEELRAALSLIGITPTQLIELGFVDQESSAHLDELVETLLDFLRSERPDVIITHPYEGGHPDHDATSFAVHVAAHAVDHSPSVLEAAFYHQANSSGSVEPLDFLPFSTSPMETKFVLEGEMFELKKRMLECFQTQQKTLSLFPANFEKYRPAPHYDFTRPPHLGKLYYENFHWGVNGNSWRKLAQDALMNWRASA